MADDPSGKLTPGTDEPLNEELRLYDKLIAAIPSLERKGASVPYTSHNGHMFSYLSKSGTLALRLPDDTREAFLKKYQTTLCKQYGVVQKEYVEVPAALLRRTAELKKYLALSYDYVRTLKLKPAVKKVIKKT
jgi:TfoX/Sxy family transcriptional regulator of competence genes